MEPTYHDGDLVITDRADSYQPGDIIAYYPSTDVYDRASLTIHRVLGRTPEGNYTTQGDNRPSPDQWVARPQDVLGEAWLHLPHMGKAVLWIQQPRHLAFILAGFLGISLVTSQKARRRHVNANIHARKHQTTGRVPGLPSLEPMVVALGIAATLMLIMMFALVYSVRQPARETVVTMEPHYVQEAAFDYTVQVERSTLYPEGIVGPIRASASNAESPFLSTDVEQLDSEEQPAQDTVETPVPPIYRKLAQTMDLGFSYELISELPSDLEGEYSANLVIKAGEDGWSRTEELIEPTAFKGETINFRVPIAFNRLSDEFTTVEEETGFRPGTYQISVVPMVNVHGTIGSRAIDETYSPSFDLEMTAVQITPDAELRQSQTENEIVTRTDTRTLRLPGLSLSIVRVRMISTVGATLALCTVAFLAIAIVRKLRQDEQQLIRMRYGSMLVSVDEVDHAGNQFERIRLSTIQDLARLAERDGQIIFNHEEGPEGRRYFVQHGTVVYEYSAPDSMNPSLVQLLEEPSQLDQRTETSRTVRIRKS